MRLAIIATLSLILVACVSASVVTTQGPAVVRTGTSIAVQWALQDKDATAAEALKIKGFIQDGRALIESGSAPASALDVLAVYLNSKIEDVGIRMAISQGVEIVKASITLPTTGIIPEDVKVWVYAVLDGATDGCQAYANGRTTPAAGLISAPQQISFR